MGWQINALHAHELDYKIQLRGLKPKGPVDDRRKILRGLLSQESANLSFTQPKNSCKFDRDHREILESLVDLRAKISDFVGTSCDVKYKNLTTRLWYVTGRINRMIVGSDAEQKIQEDVLVQILMLESDLDSKLNPVTSTPNTTAPNPPQFDMPSHSVPVYKWGLNKFTGEGSIMAFLERVEALRVSRNCSIEELFASAGDLFESQAWTWWHNHHLKNRFVNWEDLVEKLKETFLRDHYDRNLLEEIKSKKQDSKEPVAMFISSMEGLFNRLIVAPSEKDIVEIIQENLLPDYVKALALQDISSIAASNQAL
ncbi:hypothetical protein HUJ05_013307 [Dendroctonus ponderosae]|nr:hypothetical protein HUJ05_013307 [Dendroctonus ponderosae]